MTHTVTVTTRLYDEGTEDESRTVDRVTFTCDAPTDADCRRWPNCDCESWSWDDTGTRDENGHERVSGQPCWLSGWFDAEGAVYVGDDYDDMRDDCVPAIDRTGEIVVKFHDEWPEWTFVEPADHVHEFYSVQFSWGGYVECACGYRLSDADLQDGA